MRTGIVGAGMAGLACAEALQALGHHVSLFDKGRGAGGRMSTKRVETGLGNVSFDHGAQYLTARDPKFVEKVEAWAAAGLVARWSAAGGDAWVGMPAMNQPVKTMAAECDVAWGIRVDAIVRTDDGWRLRAPRLEAGPFDSVVVAVPAEQTGPLLATYAPDMADLAAGTPSLPCWTAMAAFSERLPVGDVVRDAGPIGWAARNSSKPERTPPEAWVIQAEPEWSEKHIEDDHQVVAAALLAGLEDHVGLPLPVPVTLVAHRWRYARSSVLGRNFLWDRDLRLGACGDWLLGPRVESAWLSGTRLAHEICR